MSNTQPVRITYTVRGSIGGWLWWPYGAPAFKSFEFRSERNGRDQRETIRDIAETIVTREGTDFSTAARMMADCVLTITRWGTTHHTSRTWDLARFASIAADYLSEEWPAWQDGDA